MTEQFKLGVHPPIRESGDIKDTPGCTLEGPPGASGSNGESSALCATST
jgi:propanediol utilization protein